MSNLHAICTHTCNCDLPFPPALPQVVELVPPGPLEEGEDLVSTCSVSGTPPPEITWLKDGVPLSNNQSRVTIGDLSSRQSRLEIVGVTTADSGIYTCSASNLADVALSSFNVDVAGKCLN